MKQFLTPFLIGATLMILSVIAAHAEVGGTYPEIGCKANGECSSFLCTVVTPQREHCVKVPLPRARPMIPCDTDSDCMAKNGGNGDPISAHCYDPQEDETFGEDGILCRDGESY